MATRSGVYYVDPGDEPQNWPGAVLEFEHPIQAMVMNFFPGLLPSTLLVRPEAGLVVLFPSSLVHSVRMWRATPHLRAVQRTHAHRNLITKDQPNL
jgi:hypothetical protein